MISVNKMPCFPCVQFLEREPFVVPECLFLFFCSALLHLLCNFMAQPGSWQTARPPVHLARRHSGKGRLCCTHNFSNLTSQRWLSTGRHSVQLSTICPFRSRFALISSTHKKCHAYLWIFCAIKMSTENGHQSCMVHRSQPTVLLALVLGVISRPYQRRGLKHWGWKQSILYATHLFCSPFIFMDNSITWFIALGENVLMNFYPFAKTQNTFCVHFLSEYKRTSFKCQRETLFMYNYPIRPSSTIQCTENFKCIHYLHYLHYLH